jgi:PAS domain S-box-containing protein
MRQTGIEVVGEAPWGTHFCQFYATKDDLRDILVPYFKAGLEANELCMWVTSAPLGVREAWDALAKAVPDLESYRRRGRIEIIPHTEWYLLGGSFEQDRVLKGWVAKLEDALARGCAGLRLTGNTFWLEKANWQSFAEYEAAVDGVLGQYRMLALCTYALDRCGASEVADVIRNHQFALIKRDGRWELFESFDRRRMQDALNMERERLAVTLQSIGDAVIATDTDGRVAMLNRVAEDLTGWSQHEASGRSVRDVFRIIDEETGEPAEDPVRKVLELGTCVGLANHTALVTRDGRRFPIADSAAPIHGRAGETLGAVLVFRDVTAARQMEQERDITIEFLRLLNDTTGVRALVECATAFFKKRSGCDAVGIRLREGDDYPYCEARGFPETFVLSESSLCSRDGSGEVMRDAAGDPVLACMCGNVIRGRFDRSKPFFTPAGSFWTNGTTELLASTTKEDRLARTRDRCNGEGYESVALFPLRSAGERMGLLQLNDRRKGHFTQASIALWERLAGYLAVALATARAQQDLRASETRNRLLFQNMLDGFAYCRMLFDENGRPEDFVYLDVNAAFGRLTGLRDVVGKRVSEVIPGLRESQPELLEIYGRVATTGQAERFEVEIRQLGIWLSIAVYSPHPDHFVAVFDNITERKRGEQALRESEERYRTLFTSMTEGFTLSRALHDQAGRLVDFVVMDANQAAERFNGLAREELIGKTWRDLWPGAEQHWWNICDDVLREGRDVRYENYARIHDRWYEVHQFRVAKGLMGTIFTDITARKRAEESVRAANARLTEADRRKNEFLGMLSHELRNPLAPIRNSIYILDHAAATGDQAARAKAVIKRQAEHLTRLVDDLLDVTRIARGKIEVKPSRLDLALLVRRVGEDHVALMRQSGIEFTVDVPGEPMWADGDPTRLAQVIGNLLHNSAKFTARGGLVTLALEPVRGAAEIHVRDTGVGMEPELLMHVFEPFVQAQRTLARTDGGLGLGLALVKGIAELHGGSARAASAGPGQGAEFVVRLPLVEAGASDPAALPRAVRTAGSRRVLVVDDNEDAAESLAQLVELFGHAAEVAYDGPSAMAKARANPPDVIFCDLGLPGMSGYELVRALRSDEALRRTQVFAVSGYAQPEDRKKAADAGFDGHIAKPSDPDQIERLLA